MNVLLDTTFFQNPPKSLMLQGLLTECKPADVKLEGGKTAKVLNLSLLVSEPVNKNGVEMTSLVTHVLTAKNGESFGEFYNCLGSQIALPVSIWSQEGRSGFWIPSSSRPKKLTTATAEPPKAVAGSPSAAPNPAVKSPF